MKVLTVVWYSFVIGSVGLFMNSVCVDDGLAMQQELKAKAFGCVKESSDGAREKMGLELAMSESEASRICQRRYGNDAKVVSAEEYDTIK